MSKSRRLKAIREYYKDKLVSKDIKNMKVDYDRLEKGLNNPNMETELDRIYKKYNITRYKSELDFYDKMVEKGATNTTPKLAKKRWNEYMHREDLMISGQYEENRDIGYRKTYMEQLSKAGVDSAIITKLSELSNEQWLDLTRVKQPDNSKNVSYGLPMIQDYYIIKGLADTGDRITEIENDIEEAYKNTFGKNIFHEDIDDNFIVTSDNETLWYGATNEEYVNDNRAYKEVSHKFNTKASKILRKIPRKYREQIDFTNQGYLFRVNMHTYYIENDIEGRFALVEFLESKGTAKLRTTTRGTQYYPFYLNRKETAEYLAWKRNREK